MQENDFEKQVHQKMVELRLPPSDAVWEQVEMRLHRNEKRKRWIIWFPLLAAGLFLGGYFAINNGHLLHTLKMRASEKTVREVHNKNDHTLSTTVHEGAPKATNETGHTKITSINADSGKTTVNNTSGTALKEKESANNTLATSLEPADGRLVESPVKNSGFKKHTTRASLGRDMVNKNSRDGVPESSTAVIQKKKNKQDIYQDKVTASPVTTEPVAEISEYTDDRLESANISEISPATDSVKTSLITIKENRFIKITGKQQQQKDWEWGLSLQVGKLSLANANLDKIISVPANVQSSPNFNLSATGNPAGNRTYLEPYPTHASTGFTAGAFVKKNLSGRFAVSIGINYTLYTTSTKVGKKVDSTIQSNFLGFQRSVDQYFQIGSANNYINKYHYIEVPVSIQTRLTKNGKSPLFWDLGLSVSRLVASNALHFDNITGLYYKNNDLLNKTQFDINTGFPLRLTSGKNYKLQAGPTLQYGFSSVLDKGMTPVKHFLFFGLKANMVLGKK